MLGLVLGLSGVGAGAVLTPALILGLRLQPSAAVGTSLAFSLVTKLAGGAQHLRQGTLDPRTAGWLAAGSLPVALATSLLITGHSRLLSEAATRRLVAAAVVLAALAMTARLTGLLEARRFDLRGPRLAPLGALLGAVYALTSVGSGSIGVAALATVTPIGIATLVGTDVAHAALMALVTAPVYLAAGRVEVGVLAGLLTGSVPGVMLGSRLVSRLPERVVKGTVLVAVWAVAARLA